PKALSTIVIVGPTASGKTKKSIEIAKKYNAEVICADSRIVYKGFDIASAKPTPEEREGVVHHLIDITEPTKLFSAGDFALHASAAMEDIQSRGKNVIISGGTWFYITALLGAEKLPEIPQNPTLREGLSLKSSKELLDMLKSLDPKRAELIHVNNKDKIIRSIEMCKFLNTPISEHEREKNTPSGAIWYAIDTERDELYSRIDARVDLMFEQGLVWEFEKLMAKYGENEVISNTIGYRELVDYKNHNEAKDKIKQHTRNFAKRQLSWLSGNSDIRLIGLDEEIEIS
ncbi:tRNA dimethylallyltransferase, partial [Candidatus Gastranaerophilus sp. (ex Termes propinquus)]